MQDTYKVKGMHCASCAHHITKSLSKLSGVDECDVNVATETAKVTYDPEKVSVKEMNRAIEPMGYTLVGSAPKGDHSTMDHSKMSADEHAAHLGINQSKEEKLQEIRGMKRNVTILIPFIVLSFLYMILDMGGREGLFPEMSEWLYELWHHLFPVMATYVLFVIGKNYIFALRRFLKTGVASMDTLI